VRDRLDALSPGKPLRVWVPQCSAGEDAYSVAICLLESLGSRWREIPLYVLATDSNADALFRAREGRYSARSVRGVPAARRSRFFVREADRIRVNPQVRGVCRFAIHGHLRTSPFSRLDAIVLRETLSGIAAHARRDALRSFHSVLGPGGVLIDHSGAAADASELFAPFGGEGVFIPRNPGKGAPLRETDLTLADARLLESEERFRVLFSRAEDAILVRDAETDAILQANEAAHRLYGWNSAEFLAMRGKDLLAPTQAARRPGAERRSEERLRLPQHRRKNGDFFPADTSTALLMIKGRPCNILMVRDAASRLRLAAGRRREE
jgi:PAS domain S-box-containing protein